MTASPQDASRDPRNANLPLVNHPETLLGTTISFLSIAVLAASVRLWIRFRDRLWGWDDACVFLALICSVAADIMVCQMPYDGLGLHFYTLGYQDITAYFKHVWATNSAYCASTTFIKLAILFQYMRLFAETATSTSAAKYRLARRCLWTMIIICATWGFTFFLLALFPCRPIEKNWNPFLKGTCVGWGTKDPNKFFGMWVAHTATNMCLDIIVLLLPLPFLGMLRLGGKSKLGLISLFAMGAVVAIVSVGRLISLCIKRAGTVPIPDMTYYTPVVYIFSVLEVNIAILVASIPVFWPMITSFANNKILVVNEIVVQVEQYPKTSLDGREGIGLAEQAAFKSPPESPGTASQPPSSCLSNITRKFDRRPSQDTNMLSKHKSKSSVASSIGKTLSRSNDHPRDSEESQRHLYNAPSHETVALGQSDYEWFADLDKTQGRSLRIENGRRTSDTRRPSEK